MDLMEQGSASAPAARSAGIVKRPSEVKATATLNLIFAFRRRCRHLHRPQRRLSRRRWPLRTSSTAAKIDPAKASPDDTEGDAVVEYNPKGYWWWDPNGGGEGIKMCKEAKDTKLKKGGIDLCGEECYNDIACDKQNCIGSDCPEKDPNLPDPTAS